MKKLLLLLLILIAGLVLGPWLAGNAGYVLVRIAGYRIEMTLVTLALLLLLVMISISLSSLLLRRLLRLPLLAGQVRHRRRQFQLERREREGIMRLLAGDSRGAWALLRKASASLPPLAQLVASDAAQASGAPAEAQALRELLPRDEPLMRLALARRALDRDELEQAAALLEAGNNYKDGTWLQLRQELASRQQDWSEVETCLAALRKLGYIDSQQAGLQAADVHRGQLLALAEREGAGAAESYFRRLPRTLRKSAAMLITAAEAQLLAANAGRGQALLAAALAADIDDNLLERIAALPKLPAEALILDTKKLITKRGETVPRLLLLAQLCERAGRSGEAANYRQQAAHLS